MDAAGTAPRRGSFIVMEGLDGSGKSTNIALLAERMRKSGRSVFVTAEPTDGDIGRLIRRTLAGEDKRTQSELACLFIADRIHHNTAADGIRAHLAAGDDVICDRYYYSTYAYQGGDGRMAWLRAAHDGCPDITKPDICIFLDIDTERGLSRVGKRGEKTEIFEKKSVLDEVRRRYLEIREMLGEEIVFTDTHGSVEEVAERVYSAVIGILR